MLLTRVRVNDRVVDNVLLAELVVEVDGLQHEGAEVAREDALVGLRANLNRAATDVVADSVPDADERVIDESIATGNPRSVYASKERYLEGGQR